MSREEQFCGCCGNEIGKRAEGEPLWCGKCRPHVLSDRHTFPWLRTFEAVNSAPCPFQVVV